MEILAHDENSMTNLFFSEVHRHNRIGHVLQRILWRDHERLPLELGDAELQTAELHQQIGLSEFGRPDATILVTGQKGVRHVLIIEGKLGKYLESAGPTRGGLFDNQFNSRINNQLALRYRAMRCVQRLETDGHLSELPHDRESPYASDIVRRCKKRRTLDFLKDKVRVSQRHEVYLVALTLDNCNLFRDTVNSGHELSPLFYDQEEESRVNFRNLGNLSWTACNEILQDVENFFTPSYLALVGASGLNNELPEAEPALSHHFHGRQLVEYRGEVCLLNCHRSYSYSLNVWRNDNFVEVDRGKKDRRKYASLENRVRLLGEAPEINQNDVQGWINFMEKNLELLLDTGG